MFRVLFARSSQTATTIMDDTLGRVKVKNDELKRHLRSLIMQETPYKKRESNLGKSVLETDKENDVSVSPIKRINEETPTRLSRHMEPAKAVVEHHVNLAGPGGVKKSVDTSKGPIGISREPANVGSDIFGVNSDRQTKPTLHKMPENPETRYYAPQKPTSAESNLLLNKVKTQSEEIDLLKQYIKQLKHENNLLQQDNYSKLQTISENKSRTTQEIKTVTEHFEKMMALEQKHQTQLNEQVNTLTEQNDTMKTNLDRKQSEITVLKEVLKAVSNELNLVKSAEYTDIMKLNNFQTYSRIMKQFIQQNIVNKLTDDFDKLGILLDQQMVDTELVQHFDDNRFEDLDEDNTTDLINFNRDNTTDVLIKHKNYISIEKLIINSIKPKRDPKSRLRVYIRFIICVNRFKAK